LGHTVVVISAQNG